jgi:hypothetical protein
VNGHGADFAEETKLREHSEMTMVIERLGSGLHRIVYALAAAVLLYGTAVQAQVSGFMQAVAEAAAEDADIAAFYRETGYAPLWTGKRSGGSPEA